MDNLLELVGKQLTPEIVKAASGVLGESENNTQSAVAAMLPSLMGAMAQKGSTESGAAGLLKMMTDQGDTSDMLGNFAGMLGDSNQSKGLMDSGGSMLSGLLGDNLGSMVGMISKFSGMSSGSSQGLMGMLMPMIMGILGKKVLGDGMGAKALMGLLGGQKDFIGAAMPKGLDLSGVSGLMPDLPNVDMPNVNMPNVNMPNVKAPNISAPDVNVPDVNVSGGLPKWLLPLVGLLVLAGLLWWLFGGSSAPEVSLPDAPDIDVPAINLDTDVMASACEGVGSITGAISDFGEINADTDAGGLSGMIATVRGAFDNLSGLAGLAEAVGFSQIGDAIAVVEGLLDGLDGGIGDAAGEISAAVGGISDAAGGLAGGLSCE